MTNNLLKDKNYFTSLDFLRGLSGYGVAITHFYAFLYKNAFMEYLSFLFVEFFFILSGFVLFPQLIRVLNNSKNLLNFYLRRWMRTIPLYILCLLMVSTIFNEVLSKDFFKYLFFIQDIRPNFLDNYYYPVVWSLSIEEIFYLFFPLIIILFGKENFLFKIILLFIFLIIFKNIFFNKFDLDFIRTGTLFRFDAILLGFILRFFYTRFNSPKIISTFLIIALVFYFFSEGIVSKNQDLIVVKVLFVPFLQFLSVMVLCSFINFENTFKRKYLKNFSVIISKQTYSVYLTHIIFIYIFLKLNLNSAVEFILYLILLFASSSFFYYFVEKPILVLRPKLKH